MQNIEPEAGPLFSDNFVIFLSVQAIRLSICEVSFSLLAVLIGGPVSPLTTGWPPPVGLRLVLLARGGGGRRRRKEEEGGGRGRGGGGGGGEGRETVAEEYRECPHYKC